MQGQTRIRAFVLTAAWVSLTLLGSANAKENAKSGTAFPHGHYGSLDALPDWGGVWTLNFSPPASGTAAPEKPALKGQFLKDYQTWQREVEAKGGLVARQSSNCMPPGLPGIMGVFQYPMEFLFTPGKVTIHLEAWMQWRTVYTDGRSHPSEWEPTFYGHSIGHWEKDGTLVVDSIGIKPAVAMSTGMKHSDQMRIVERFHLAKDDPNTLVLETTIEDPLALEKPWHTRATYARSREGELLEFVCAENDRNPVDAAGNTQFK